MLAWESLWAGSHDVAMGSVGSMGSNDVGVWLGVGGQLMLPWESLWVSRGSNDVGVGVIRGGGQPRFGGRLMLPRESLGSVGGQMMLAWESLGVGGQVMLARESLQDQVLESCWQWTRCIMN